VIVVVFHYAMLRVSDYKLQALVKYYISNYKFILELYHGGLRPLHPYPPSHNTTYE